VHIFFLIVLFYLVVAEIASVAEVAIFGEPVESVGEYIEPSNKTLLQITTKAQEH